MKELLCFSILCLLSSPAFGNFPLAGDPALIESTMQDGQSRLETLVGWFEEGRFIGLEELRGRDFSGRCYNIADPSKPLPGLLVNLLDEDGEDHGPGFPTENLKLSFNWKQGLPANYFDVGSLSESRLEYYRRKITRRAWPRLSEAYSVNGILTFDYDWEMNGNVDERDQYIAYNDLIIMVSRAMFAQSYYGVPLEVGDVHVACYFFEEIQFEDID